MQVHQMAPPEVPQTAEFITAGDVLIGEKLHPICELAVQHGGRGG
jgi:hypothetical protein